MDMKIAGTSAGTVTTELGLDQDELRLAIQKEYREAALHPEQGFHFHTGRALAPVVGYKDEWVRGIPESAVESFAGTGNPFSMGELRPGVNVVDVGCGAGIDSLIAARMVEEDSGPIRSYLRKRPNHQFQSQYSRR